MLYQKAYRIRFNSRKVSRSLITGIPYDVVERQAKSHSLTIVEFMEQYEAVYEYNDTEDIRLTFRPIYGLRKK